ncbi:hypothetical protein [Pectobacterium phage Wc4-1]|uniref:Uncharacterized protein n=1 Tax=Pectobacterium phage Wc4 TaxID=2652428 RepID=A0A5P8D498_9CAUD|nr:hypothetical protein [Pectobacterium phage Wc4]QFP94051.1 hypothetical protein [Pectobacterium phage Wc4-1]
MTIKPDLIELASKDEKVAFILQQLKLELEPLENKAADRWASAAFFHVRHGIQLPKEVWDTEVWPVYFSEQAKEVPEHDIHNASQDVQEAFVIEQYKLNRGGVQGSTMDGVATYFSHMFNIRFSKEYWETTLWDKLNGR